MERLATTPFGGGRMTARNFVRQTAVAERQAILCADDGGGNDKGQVDKWQVLRALTEAAGEYGLSDRTICLLEALVSFTPGRELDGRAPIIVFPSNRELSLRARAMAPATIRRHLAVLVEAGMIFRRDSANGKRYCQRDETGSVEDAFGFDLAPLALRSGEIIDAAEKAREKAKRVRRLRAEITLHQRDIAKIIEMALAEAREGDWLGHSAALALPGMSRHAGIAELEERLQALEMLRHAVERDYLDCLSQEEMSANDSYNERHHQNSNTDLTFESHGKETKAGGAADQDQTITQPQRKLAISLKKLKALCPLLSDYARDGISSWSDVISAAEVVRSMLGVSPDAWLKARKVLGEQAAAVVVAAMLERAEEIRSAGGYLRNLTDKAEQGKFSIFPMLQALERRRE